MSGRPPARQRKRPPGPIREQANVRVEFVSTILMDTVVLLTAFGCRVLFLRVFAWLVPGGPTGTVAGEEPVTWAIRALEWIADVGLVAAAGVFVIFDVLKRVIISFRALVAVARGREEQ